MSGKPQTIDQHKQFSKLRCDSVLRTARVEQSWWDTPNDEFNQHTPAEMWDNDYEQVYRHVMLNYARQRT